MSKRLIILGAFRFPSGDAAAARVLGTGKLLREMGYTIEFAGWGEHPSNTQEHVFQGFKYCALGEFRNGPLKPHRRLLRFLMEGQGTMEWLRDKDLSDVEAIIAYHGSSAFILRLARFCRQRGIRFMFDCTEWYDPRALPGGGWGLPAIDSEIRMRFVYPYVGRGIVISYYLENYYNKSGCNVARLPPLIDLQDEKWGGARAAVPPSSMSPLRIAYAGFPGKKDLLLNALRGLPKLKTLGIDVVLEIYGPTQSEFLSSINAEPVDDLLEGVIFHGRKRQVEIPALVASAHFSLLVRPDKRSSHAGFPTKLVESWAIGVPVIANITGDMGRYVVDGVNGVVLKDASTSAFVEAIKKIGALNLADYLMMRRNVQELAEKEFDFRNFIRSSAIAKLLENN